VRFGQEREHGWAENDARKNFPEHGALLETIENFRAHLCGEKNYRKFEYPIKMHGSTLSMSFRLDTLNGFLSSAFDSPGSTQEDQPGYQKIHYINKQKLARKPVNVSRFPLRICFKGAKGSGGDFP
jgi:hypothetical protein